MPPAYFSRRLPHVLTRVDLAMLVAPTYGEVVGVDEDLGDERLQKAFADTRNLEDFLLGVSAALKKAQGELDENAVMDKLSKGIQKRRGKLGACPPSPALSAVMVKLNLSLNLAPEQMRATLESEKGKALLADGMRTISEFLVKELVR